MNAPHALHPSPKTPPSPQQAEWLIRPADLIADFLRQKRIAIVGVSRDKRHFSRMVFNEFRKRGYDVVPCNPHETMIQDVPAFSTVKAIEPPVDAVVIMTSPTIAEAVVHECAESGVKRVWFHKGSGLGAASEKAITFCREHNIKVIAGFCPLMFLPEANIVHRLHGFFKRINRTYPN
jgi:predicted CoA-binding protein